MKVLIFLAILSFIIGCNTVEPTEKNSHITGSVLDDSTSELLDSVSVSIITVGGSFNNNVYHFGYATLTSTTTNGYGFYSLNALIEKDRHYYLCASKEGYKSISQYSISKRIVLAFADNQNIDIRLEKY